MLKESGEASSSAVPVLRTPQPQAAPQLSPCFDGDYQQIHSEIASASTACVSRFFFASATGFVQTSEETFSESACVVSQPE